MTNVAVPKQECENENNDVAKRKNEAILKESTAKSEPKLTKCPHCPKSFIPKRLRPHIRRVHEAPKRKQNKTPKSTATKDREYYGKPESMCPKCCNYFLHPEQHISKCRANETEKCPHCSKSMRPKTLRRHIKRVHYVMNDDDRDRLYECFICHKEEPTLSLMASHIKRHPNHTLKSKFVCAPCDSAFRTEHQYKRHLNEHGICTICGKGSVSDLANRAHMIEQHVSEAVFECYLCKVIKRSHWLTLRHMRSEHIRKKIRRTVTKSTPRLYLCTHCGASFPDGQSLAIHMTRDDHQGMSGALAKKFVCDECNARFSRNYQLKVHKHLHTGEKPYKCKLCDKYFRSHSHASEHRKVVHLKQNRYKCHICPYTTNSRKRQRQHFSKHGEEERKENDKKAV